jgi:X-X-X-Leu-X-X-Gly heptad repeat protein
MSLDKGTYLDALTQGAQDVADGLDRLAEKLGA